MDTVAPHLDDVTTVLDDHQSQELVVTRQRVGHRVAVLFPEPRRRLEVGEQHCHCPRRQLTHYGTKFSTARANSTGMSPCRLWPASSKCSTRAFGSTSSSLASS